MFELLILAAGVYVGYHLGQMVLSWQLRDLIFKEARKEGIRIDANYNIIGDNDEKHTVLQLFVETSNDTLYLYERDKDRFICQAKTLEELATLSLRYGNIKYAAVLHGDTVVAFVNGEVKVTI
jgi:hypothetical protein